MKGKLIAFHGKPEIKEEYLNRIRMHKAADQIVHGQYWEDGKGCAVGCTIHGNQHYRYETELGIPRHLAYLEDSIFEGLSNGNSLNFPEQFLSAIKVGADLSLVYHKFMVWMLIHPSQGVLRFADECGSIAIKRVAELHQLEINGAAAGAAAWAAARAAAGAAAGAAAWAAARAAAWAAAWDAARDAAWDAAGAAARIQQRDQLLKLLSEAI